MKFVGHGKSQGERGWIASYLDWKNDALLFYKMVVGDTSVQNVKHVFVIGFELGGNIAIQLGKGLNFQRVFFWCNPSVVRGEIEWNHHVISHDFIVQYHVYSTTSVYRVN